MMEDFSSIPPLFEELTNYPSLDQSWIDYFQNNDCGLKTECCSFNVMANAKGLAKLASIMANRGQGLISEATWNQMHAEDCPELEYIFGPMKIRTRFTKGGVNYFQNLNDANFGEKEGMCLHILPTICKSFGLLSLYFVCSYE